MKTTGLALAAILTAMLAGCTDKEEHTRVEFQTSLGSFVVETFNQEAPITVENFLQYVQSGFYDDTLIHRVSKDFVIQGGGWDATSESIKETRAPIKNEAKTSGLPNEAYTLSMARGNSADSATSQFFVNVKDNEGLDPGGFSPDGYAVFAQLVGGQSVVDAIHDVPVTRSSAHRYCISLEDAQGGSCPVEPVVVHKATIVSGPRPATLPAPTPADVHADLITPGAWHVTHASEAILAWADNRGGTQGHLDWRITSADGGPLPDGWTLSFDSSHQVVGADKSSTQTVHTMVRLTVPEGTDGEFPLELHTGQSTTPFVATVGLIHDRISKAGDAVTADYVGTCTKDGKEFDAGNFPLTLGGGRAIVGFDLGLIGLGLDEPATLVIPAALAYGDKGGPCGGLDPADLRFEVKITSFE